MWIASALIRKTAQQSVEQRYYPTMVTVHSACAYPKQFSMPWTFFLGEHPRHPRSSIVTHYEGDDAYR